jgi:polyphosphate kinase 2 (PPK2 family)
VDSGIHLIKFWLEASDAEQKRRFAARINDPLRQWKLSPVDLPSRQRWYDYSRARDLMLEATDTAYAPWYRVFGSIGTENRFKECSPYHSGRVRANKTVNCGHMHPEHLGDLFGRLAFTQ